MSRNEFDRLLNDKFEQQEFAYNPAGWEQLADRLPANHTDQKVIAVVPWLKITGIAAALAITVSGVAWFYHTPVKRETTANILREPEQSVTTAGIQTVPLPDKENTPARTLAYESASATPNNNMIRSKAPVRTHTVVMPGVPDKEYTSDTQDNTTDNEHIANFSPESSLIKEKLPDENAGRKDLSVAQANKKLNIYDFPASDGSLNISRRNASFLSVTGGMNYGSMNTGYMAGLNAKQKLGGRLFVEGDLAMVNNRATETFTQQQQQFAVLNKAPIDYRNVNLLYVAFNPAVGYQVLKNVSVGLGADVQRMINNDDLLVQVTEEIHKTIPGTDIGLTGKTEISLSEKLKAGILYREGVNNFLNSSNQFFDRRYLQVQLKFTVAGK